MKAGFQFRVVAYANEKKKIEILSEPNVLKPLKKINIEGRTTYNLKTSSFDILILSHEDYLMQPGSFPVPVFLNKPP